MNTDKPDKLNLVREQSASTDELYLIKVKEEAKKAMHKDPNQKNRKAFLEAMRAHNDFQKMQNKQDLGENSGMNSGANLGFRSLAQVYRYLVSQGYKVGKSKLYKDKTSFPADESGCISLRLVENYAATLKLAGGGNGDDVPESQRELQERKLRAEVEKYEKQAETLALKLEIERGKYIPRKDFEMELATRAGVFEAGLKHHFQTAVQDFVFMVEGNPDKSRDLLAALLDGLDQRLNEFADTKQFTVVFENE